VDNASLDDSVDHVRSKRPDVKLIANPANRGFATANNQGLEIAAGDYAVLLNSDTVAHRGSLAALVEFLDSRPRAGAAAPRLVDAAGETDPSASGLPHLRMQVASLLSLKQALPASVVRALLAHRPTRALLQRMTAGYFIPALASGAPREVHFLSGACLVVRREVWQSVGGLDENIFMYLEDADWCRRIADAGWSLWYVPSATVTHLGGKSVAAASGGHSHRDSRERLESLRYYFRKHESRRSRVVLEVVIVASAMGRIALAVVRRDRAEARRLWGSIRK
jgi:GT2 family glycosyltransferase